MKKHFLIFTFFLSVLLSIQPIMADTAGVSRQLTTKLDALFKASRSVNADGEEKVKARNQIEGSMDWEKIAQVCLGNYAKRNAGKNLNDFKTLLRDVVVKTAYSRLDKFWDGNTSYKYEKIEFKGGSAKVPCKFTVKGEPFVLEYFFSEKGNQWLIYDISYDDVRYSTNISEQISAFLKEKSFAELLGKLRKRKDELSEDAKPRKSSF